LKFFRALRSDFLGESAANAYIRCATIEKETGGDPADNYLEAATMQRKYNTASI